MVCDEDQKLKDIQLSGSTWVSHGASDPYRNSVGKCGLALSI